MDVVREAEVIVIGGGVAGCTAALYAKRYGLEVVLLDKGVPGGQLTTISRVENYPGFPEGITGVELAERVRQQVENHDVPFIPAEATHIEAHDGKWLVHTTKGDYLTIAVIIVTGVFPRSLQVPGEEELRGMGVSYCATCDGFFFRGQIVAVVGGGNTALEEALYLADITDKVYVIHRRERLRADPYVAERVLGHESMEVVWNSVVEEIIGDSQVEALRLRDTLTGEQRMLEVAGVFIAVGTVAHTEWLADLLELSDEFIVTDINMQTSQPGIFAAGDIRNTPLRQITTAVGDAAIAGYSAYQYVAGHRGEVYGDYEARGQSEDK